MPKEAQFVGKIKLASGSGAARKRQAEVRGNYENVPRWFDLTSFSSLTLSNALFDFLSRKMPIECDAAKKAG